MAQLYYCGESGGSVVYGEVCSVIGFIPSLTETRQGDVYIGKFGVFRNSDGEAFICPVGLVTGYKPKCW